VELTRRGADDMARSWRSRIIVGTSIGDEHPPAWLAAAYAVFHANVVRDDYPCYFGSAAERNGALYYSYASSSTLEHLPATLRTFIGLCTDIRRDKNNLVVFFEPTDQPVTHTEHRALFWDILRYLRDRDPDRQMTGAAKDPSDPLWEFPFGGHQFFVVGVSPTYQRHRSRNLGPCMMMLFQPREVFEVGATADSIGDAVRQRIRERVQQWDGLSAHPDLNTYGRPDNFEWTQYFISDDNSRETGRCPLSHGARTNGTSNRR
jgi:FPC/CPF motif-containing protein YcgG